MNEDQGGNRLMVIFLNPRNFAVRTRQYAWRDDYEDLGDLSGLMTRIVQAQTDYGEEFTFAAALRLPDGAMLADCKQIGEEFAQIMVDQVKNRSQRRAAEPGGAPQIGRGMMRRQ